MVRKKWLQNYQPTVKKNYLFFENSEVAKIFEPTTLKEQL